MAGLLLIVAHPDDEFFCAGALAALRQNNVPVTVAYWTRGEGGGGPRSRRLYSWLPTFCQPRVREAAKSMRCLRISDWTYLGYCDPVPSPGLKAPEHDPLIFRSQLRELMENRRPELIMTHGSDGEYGHPAHVILHQQVAGVLESWAEAPGLITFSAARLDQNLAGIQNVSDRADTILDCLPYAVQKRGVLEAHRSQKKVWGHLVPETGGSLSAMVDLSRREYYHCGKTFDRNETLRLFNSWSGAQPV